jgi:hypothetical protein
MNGIIDYIIIMWFGECKIEFLNIGQGQGRPGPAQGQGQGQSRVDRPSRARARAGKKAEGRPGPACGQSSTRTLMKDSRRLVKAVVNLIQRKIGSVIPRSDEV